MLLKKYYFLLHHTTQISLFVEVCLYCVVFLCHGSRILIPRPIYGKPLNCCVLVSGWIQLLPSIRSFYRILHYLVSFFCCNSICLTVNLHRNIYVCERVCCCVLLCAVVSCCVLLFAVVCCCVLLCAVVCCCVLLCALVCCCLLLCVVVCCCVLLCAVVCCCVPLCAVVYGTCRCVI